MQIRYKKDGSDYALYKKHTIGKDGKTPSRFKQLAFMFALYKIRNNAHIQCVVSGEFSQGKTSAATLLAKYEQKYVRIMLRQFYPETYGNTKGEFGFTVEDSIIISPLDPASKALSKPKPWHSYVIDEGYLFATSSESGTSKTKKIRNNIVQNRKKHPSMYWCYPNLFKMPALILEIMDVAVHKERVQVGDTIIPSRAIQIKEKFDKDRIAKYAKYPRLFPKLIRFHPSFVAKIRFPKIKESSQGWKLYLQKYDRYEMTDEVSTEKVSGKDKFFDQIDKLIDKRVLTVNSKADIGNFIFNMMRKNTKLNDESAKALATTMADEYLERREEKITKQLTESLNKSMLSSIESEVGVREEGG